MTDISKEAVERLWKEYCDASTSTGVLPGGIEEFDVDEMNNRAFDLFEHAKALQARVEELEARADLPAAVTVKPLEWHESPMFEMDEYGCEVWGEFQPDTIVATCRTIYCGIYRHSFNKFMWVDGTLDNIRYSTYRKPPTFEKVEIPWFDSIDAAKAAAQTHHERRILSKVNVTTAPVAETRHISEDEEKTFQHLYDWVKGADNPDEPSQVNGGWIAEMLKVLWEEHKASPAPAAQPDAVQEAARVLLEHCLLENMPSRPLIEMSNAMNIDAHPVQFMRGLVAALRVLKGDELWSKFHQE